MTSTGAVERAITQSDKYLVAHSGRLVVAVSGGVDSVCLAHALADHRRREDLVIAHFTHLTRTDAEHEADAGVVRKLAESLSVPLYLASAADYRQSAESRGGPENLAREARYEFLYDVCRSCEASLLLTAHTADDQLETVVMRIIQGIDSRLLSGIERYSCKRPVPTLRPLLECSKSDVIEYARSHRLRWSEDSSNTENRFRRNIVRNLILPSARAQWQALDSDILLLQRCFSSRSVSIREQAARIERRRELEGISVDASAFFASNRDVRLELLYDIVRELGLLRRRDRPSHRFFAPLLGPQAKRAGTLVHGRGIDISLRAGRLVVSPVLSGHAKVVIFR